MKENFIIHYNNHLADDDGVQMYNAWITEKNGHAFAKAYWFDDDTTTIYLSELSVNEGHRNKGIGLQLQLIREEIGREIGAKYAVLWVDKKSWMRKWYDRRGYKYFKKRDHDTTTMWLRKKL